MHWPISYSLYMFDTKSDYFSRKIKPNIFLKYEIKIQIKIEVAFIYFKTIGMINVAPITPLVVSI